jgi:hypothetical protein
MEPPAVARAHRSQRCFQSCCDWSDQSSEAVRRLSVEDTMAERAGDKALAIAVAAEDTRIDDHDAADGLA